MAKITLTDLASLANETSVVATINANHALIETALENTLSRDGTSPNTMGASLDMNSNRIINLPDPASAQEPVTKGYLDTVTFAEVPDGFTALSAFGESLLDDANAAAGRTTLGAAASGANTDITSVYLNNTGLKIKDTDASHGLSIVPGSNLSADRVLTVTTGDAARTIDISAGDVTITSAGAALLDDANAAAQRTTLGLGTIATQAASSVAITGGSVTGITDITVADGGTGASTAQNACANLGTRHTLFRGNTRLSRASNNSTDTTEAAIAGVTIPAGAIGPNGTVIVNAIWAYDNNATAKNLRVRLNGLAGSQLSLISATTTTNNRTTVIFGNRNSASSQIYDSTNTLSSGTTSFTAGTTAIDTSAAVDLVFTTAWGANVASNNIHLDYYLVEVIYGA